MFYILDHKRNITDFFECQETVASYPHLQASDLDVYILRVYALETFDIVTDWVEIYVEKTQQ